MIVVKALHMTHAGIECGAEKLKAEFRSRLQRDLVFRQERQIDPNRASSRGLTFFNSIKGVTPLVPVLTEALIEKFQANSEPQTSERLPARFFEAVAAPSAAATALETATTTATRPIGLWPSFIHIKGSAVQISSVQAVDRSLRFVSIRHLDKGKAARLASHPVRDKTHTIYCAILRKNGGEVLLCRLETQVSYVNVGH
jgi:hypothetical protein